MDNREELELEVRRILAAEVEGHRTFLQSQFRNITWGVGILFTVGSIIFVFLLGKSIHESKDTLISTIDGKVIDYRIIESVKKKLKESIDIEVKNAVEHERTINKINAKIDELTKDAVSSVSSDIENKLITTVNEQIITSQNLNASQIIAKVSMPSGAVMAFNRLVCPNGWSEYIPAQGRFIRGIDKIGNGADPDGKRKLGSIQSDEFLAHSHSRPRDVYDAGGGSDSAWIAGGGGFGYGSTNPPNTGISGASETRPKNVALLYCEKT